MNVRCCTLLVLTILLGSMVSQAADRACVVPGRGHFRIHLGSSGLFGAFGHDHLIEAQKIEGCATIDANNPTNSSVELAFPTAAIRVLDPKEDAKDRAEVQKTMETEVLAISQFPEITFKSTTVERAGSDQFRVRGTLTIRGKTQPIIIPVTFARLPDGVYRVTGKSSFKQSNFGIIPVRVAGGTIKVKDEVQTEFEVFLK